MIALRANPDITFEQWKDIVHGYQKVKMPKQPAGFLYFKIPVSAKKVSCNRYMEQYHHLLTTSQQSPIVNEHQERILMFQFGKVDSVRVVKVYLSSRSAQGPLTGEHLNLGKFGNVKLLCPIVDPFEDYVYMDIPTLLPEEWGQVVDSFNSLGAAPFYWTSRTGIQTTNLLDTTIRFYWNSIHFPTPLKIGGTYPQQISFGGKVHLVYIKDQSAPILSDRRKAGHLCLRLPYAPLNRPTPTQEDKPSKRRK